MALTLELRCGDETLDLNDGEYFRLLDWNPQEGEQVQEALTLEVQGADDDDLAVRLSALADMQRWAALYAGDPDAGRDPVWLHVKMVGQSNGQRALVWPQVPGQGAIQGQLDTSLFGKEAVNHIAEVTFTLERLAWEAENAETRVSETGISLTGGGGYYSYGEPVTPVQVAAGSDDARYHIEYNASTGYSYALYTGQVSLRIGFWGSLPPDSEYQYHPAWRFQLSGVSQGMKIARAELRLTASASGGVAGDAVYLRAQAADNAATFSNLADYDARSWGSAQVTYDLPQMVAGTEYVIDVTALVQEVVDRSGWASGNYLVLAVRGVEEDGSYQTIAAYENATYDPAELAVWYREAEGDLPPRMQALTVDPTVDLGKLYVGMRMERWGDLATFDPVLEYADGTMGTDASVVSGRVDVTFATETDWADRVTHGWAKAGRFLVLVRACLSGGSTVVHLSARLGYDYGTPYRTRRVVVDSTTIKVYNLGVVELPPRRATPFDVSDAEMEVITQARRFSGSADLRLYDVILLPADFLVACEFPESVTSPVALLWQDAPGRWDAALYTVSGGVKYVRARALPDEAGVWEPGACAVFFVGSRADGSHVATDTATVQLTYYPRFRYLVQGV